MHINTSFASCYCDFLNFSQEGKFEIYAIDNVLPKSQYATMKVYDSLWLKELIGGRRGVQAELAREIGVSPDKITRILNGDRKIQVEEISKIIGFFEKFDNIDLSIVDARPTDPGAVNLGDPARPELPDQEVLARIRAIWPKLSESELQVILAAGKGLHAQHQQED